MYVGVCEGVGVAVEEEKRSSKKSAPTLSSFFAKLFANDFPSNFEAANMEGNIPSETNGLSETIGVRRDSSFSNWTLNLAFGHLIKANEIM